MAKSKGTAESKSEAVFAAWNKLTEACHEYASDSSDVNAQALREAARDLAHAECDL